MTHILHEPSAAATYYLKGALCELFDFLSSGFYVTPVHLSSSPESLLFLRISRLLEDTDGRLPRSELARLLNYNGSYLNSIVQRRTGLCLFDYGMTFCFQKAERLLRETTLSVSEIALQLKFTNRTRFYELFRQKYGTTPQQWRKMQKSAERRGFISHEDFYRPATHPIHFASDSPDKIIAAWAVFFFFTNNILCSCSIFQNLFLVVDRTTVKCYSCA